MDWIAVCRESLRKAAEKIMEIYVSEKRAMELSRGKGGDMTLLADKASEDIVIERLHKLGVDVRIISEERGEVIIGRDPRYTILLDPLDGSFNYMAGIDYFAISMAVLDEQYNLVAGYVLNPPRNIEYHATEAGAFKNGTKIRTSQRSNADCVLLEYTKRIGPEDLETILKTISRILLKTSHVRGPGAAALDLCRVADGTFDCLLYGGVSRYLDVAAGIYILEKAGGMVSDFKGNQDIRQGTGLITGSLLAAGNRTIHELILAAQS